MNVTSFGWNNAGLNARAATYARSTLVKLIGRTYLDIFHYKRIIFPNINFHMKLIPSQNDYVYKSSAPAANAQQDITSWLSKASNLLFAPWSITKRLQRLRREICEKYFYWAYRSLSHRRFLLRAPYFSKYRSPHKFDIVPERFCVQVNSSSWNCSSKTLQAGYPECLIHYSHYEAY